MLKQKKTTICQQSKNILNKSIERTFIKLFRKNNKSQSRLLKNPSVFISKYSNKNQRLHILKKIIKRKNNLNYQSYMSKVLVNQTYNTALPQREFPEVDLLEGKKQEDSTVTKLKSNEYRLPFHSFQRTNQDTCKTHRPAVSTGDWVQRGDILADCASSVSGELSLGQNILVAYLPWEGYNFEDAILISERLVTDDLYTSVHMERYEMLLNNGTKFSTQKKGELKYDGLDVITREIPDILITEKKKLDSFGIVKPGSWIQEGDILVGKLSLKESDPLLESAYKNTVQNIRHVLQNKKTEDSPERGNDTVFLKSTRNYATLKTAKKFFYTDTSLRAPKKANAKVISIQMEYKENSKKSLKTVPILGGKTKKCLRSPNYKVNETSEIKKIYINLAETRKIQVGDKLSGRHGNKGIVSLILPIQDMPYLPDGTPIDMVLNPLGVPSRMNVGQIYECLLGLAGRYLGETYQVGCFDEMYGPDASRSFVFNKLYQASTVTGKSWLFDPNTPGKVRIFDGCTGESFDQAVTVGHTYMLRLVHMVDDKMHARSTGPYSLITQQPLRGRSQAGGQRLGEMEVWALEGYGAAFTLLEMLTIKSDDMAGRVTLWSNIINNKPIKMDTPESFKVLICELQALCLDIGLF